jgi:arginyl-tRNA synthetase
MISLGDRWSARLSAPCHGPVEQWLRSTLAATVEAAGAAITDVIFTEGARPGDFRVLVSWDGAATVDRTTWKDLAARVTALGGLERAVAVPPAVYVTVSPAVIERVVAEAGAARPVTEHPGVVVVFCSPNTNKPLHIGHLRACFLGMSLSRLLEAAGVEVRRSQMLSNFGIHMCQALAMLRGDEAPAGKPDWFVGELYRRYHAAIAELPACTSCQATACLRCRPLAMLRRMVDGDEALLAANRQLGEWAIEGIRATQERIGASYDSGLRESEVLRVAVDAILRGLDAGVCYRRDDGSIYVPIRTTGEAELTLLRQNGTSLVYSMLLGIYLSRNERYRGWDTIELTGEQWRAGRRAMYELLEYLGRGDIVAATEGVFFGMVQLGEQVMSSRHGNVVLADELLDRMAARVRDSDRFDAATRTDSGKSDALGIAMLKYFVLGQPRGEGFSFDEDTMWADTLDRVVALRGLLRECSAAAPSDARPTSRPLAMALARQAVIAKRALVQRDPAIVVRYIDDVVKLARLAVRKRELGAAALRAVDRVVRASLSLLDIAPHVVEETP